MITTVLGYVGVALGAISMWPQIRHTYRRPQAADELSWGFIACVCAATLCMGIHTYAIRAMAPLLVNGSTFVSTTVLAVMKLRR